MYPTEGQMSKVTAMDRLSSQGYATGCVAPQTHGGQSVLTDGLAVAVPWRCFHCDETFADAAEAAMHFGPRIYSDPACHVDAERLRELERQLDGYREEDTDLHRQIAAMESRHQQAVMRAEEAGYARGLRDAMTDGLVTAKTLTCAPKTLLGKGDRTE